MGTGSVLRDIVFRRWHSAADYCAGTAEGVTIADGMLAFARSTGHLTHEGAGYERATWTSAPVTPGFGVQEIVASWIADTPGGSWVQIEVRAHTQWYALGRWAANDTVVRRTTVPKQDDENGKVDADTFIAAPDREVPGFQLRVSLMRPVGSTDVPVVRSLGAMASRLPAPDPALEASTPRSALDVVLDVPGYSQKIHAGEYPEYDGGGGSWCSPTATSMVMAYWGALPPADDYAWVDPALADRWVDHAARGTYDYAYGGCGNWPFNTAYAGRYGLTGFVTRLRSLAEAELFIAEGIPLIVSGSYKTGDIRGLDYDTNGHIMVLAGFTAGGDPVLNDPNSASGADVRKTVDRTEFERVWLNTSRGIVYVITPPGRALPKPLRQANW
jgi:Peptidase_C39 like family